MPPTIRPARREDLHAIVALLADDVLGATREDPANLAPHEHAFAEVEADPRNVLLVGEDAADGVIASLHLTFIPSLGNLGSERALIGGVRVARTCVAVASAIDCSSGPSRRAATTAAA